MGNFCSWNCAKTYAHHKERKPPEGVYYLWILHFLTVHRPRYCPTIGNQKHSPECRCRNISSVLKMAEEKETLQAFGGSKTIEEYRQGFSVIESYDWIGLFLQHRNESYRFMEIREPRHQNTAPTLPPQVFRGKRKIIINR